MTDRSELKVKITSDFIERCERLVHDAAGRLEAGGDLTVGEVEALSRAAYSLYSDINCVIAAAELEARMARPKIGQTFSAWRFNYGDDPIGTVIADDGVKVTIEVPEHVIPAREQLVVPGYTYQAEFDEEHERWIDWTDREKVDQSRDVGER